MSVCQCNAIMVITISIKPEDFSGGGGGGDPSAPNPHPHPPSVCNPADIFKSIILCEMDLFDNFAKFKFRSYFGTPYTCSSYCIL